MIDASEIEMSAHAGWSMSLNFPFFVQYIFFRSYSLCSLFCFRVRITHMRLPQKASVAQVDNRHKEQCVAPANRNS